MKHSEQINDLATALSKAQSEMKGAIKDSENPFFKSSYADLSSVWDACREALTKNNLSVVQTTSINTLGDLTLITVLAHASGQWISGEYPVSPTKTDPQGFGSAMSYARRYALAAMVGIVQTDDDGESATNRSNVTPMPQAKTAKKAAVHAPEYVPPANAADFIIPYGKNAGKKIGDFPATDAKLSLEYWQKKLNGEKPNPKLEQYMIALTVYISEQSTAVIKPKTDSFDDIQF